MSITFITIALGDFKKGASVLASQLKDMREHNLTESQVAIISDDAGYLTAMSLQGLCDLPILISDQFKKKVHHFLSARENIGANFFNTIYKYIAFNKLGTKTNIWIDSDVVLGGSVAARIYDLCEVTLGFTPRHKIRDDNLQTQLSLRSFKVTTGTNQPISSIVDISKITQERQHIEIWDKLITGFPILSPAIDFPRANTGFFVVGNKFHSTELVSELVSVAVQEKSGLLGAKNQSDQNDLNFCIGREVFDRDIFIIPEMWNLNVGEFKINDSAITKKILESACVLHFPGEKKPWIYHDEWRDGKSKLRNSSSFFWTARREWWLNYDNYTSESEPLCVSRDLNYNLIDIEEFLSLP